MCPITQTQLHLNKFHWEINGVQLLPISQKTIETLLTLGVFSNISFENLKLYTFKALPYVLILHYHRDIVFWYKQNMKHQSTGIELRGVLSLLFAYKLLTQFTWRFCLIFFWEFQTAPSRILAMICSKIAKGFRWSLLIWNWLWIEEQGYRLSKWFRKHNLGHSKSL